MCKRINGKMFFLVDIFFDDELIYDVYEDENGNKIKAVCGCRE